MGKKRGLTVRVFAASTSVEDDHEFARELGQRLGSGRYTAEELRAFVRAARYYQAIDVLQRKTVRADASGRKPTIDIQHLLIDLAEVLAEKHHKPVRKVLGSICGGSDERQADYGSAPPELERIARAVLELAGTPVEGSLVQQARAAADLVDCGTLEYRNPSPILPPTPFSTHEPSHFMELDHATCIISRRLRPPAPNPGGPADFPFDALALGEERQVPPTG
jgi:hypothetical protein